MDNNRRQFLRIILIGSGTLIAGKVLGPLLSKSSGIALAKNNSSEFNVTEDNQFLSIYDASGEEVLQIDKSG
ncbi:MAG: hypothetical protein Q7R79_02370 [bacterium]|nr:hypothetical protein [bacterium]